MGEVEQPLLLDPFTVDLEEDPGEDAEGDEGPLDHHQGAGGALVRPAGRGSSSASPALVDGVEHSSRPHQDVAENRPDEADGDDVGDLPAGGEPGRLRQRRRRPASTSRQPKKRKVACSSCRYCRRAAVGVLIERRNVPGEEVDRPERQRHRRVDGEDLEAVEEADREDGLEQRLGRGQAEDEQQGRAPYL